MKKFLIIGIMIFFISFCSAQSLHLKQGWNLISFNTLPKDSGLENVFGDSIGNITSVWEWNDTKWNVYLPSYGKEATEKYAKSKKYGVLKEFEPEKGYWINSKKEINISLCTINCKSSGPLQLKYGWNLIRINSEKDLKEIIPKEYKNCSIASVWEWNYTKWNVYLPSYGKEATEKYAKSKGFGILKNIKPGKGYWINLKGDYCCDYACQQKDPGGWVDYHFEKNNFTRIEEVFNWSKIPKKYNIGIYPAVIYFGFQQSGGYIGPQIEIHNSGKIEKKIIFSIWDVCNLENDAKCTAHSTIPLSKNCHYFGSEGTGVSCLLSDDYLNHNYDPWTWGEGKEYKLIVEKEKVLSDGVVWRGIIQDIATGEGKIIGEIELKNQPGYKGYGLLKHAGGFFEYHSGEKSKRKCLEAEYTKFIRKGPLADEKWFPKKATYLNTACLSAKRYSSEPGIIIEEAGGGVARRTNSDSKGIFWELNKNMKKEEVDFWKKEYDKDYKNLCGDNICNESETIKLCPGDCLAIPLKLENLQFDAKKSEDNYKISFTAKKISAFEDSEINLKVSVTSCVILNNSGNFKGYSFVDDYDYGFGILKDKIELCFNPEIKKIQLTNKEITSNEIIKTEISKSSYPSFKWIQMCPTGSRYVGRVFPRSAGCISKTGKFTPVISQKYSLNPAEINKYSVKVMQESVIRNKEEYKLKDYKYLDSDLSLEKEFTI